MNTTESILGQYCTLENGIYKSINDHRIYKPFELENGLKVLAISDSKMDDSYVSLAVNCGSFNEPSDCIGLAHFCEHMILLASKKYPEENYFSKFLSTHGGSDNAYTSDEQTVFFYSINSNDIVESLEIFSDLFVSPIFTESGVDREINAIHSEFSKDLQVDYWRSLQVQKLVIPNDHPLSKFNIGNNETLKIPNIRERLLEFYNTYYSSHLMSLVILTNQTVDDVEQVARRLFSSVPRREINLESYICPDIPGLPKLIKIVPVSPKIKLHFQFKVPEEITIISRNSFCTGHLIGHESKGSIIYNLRKMGYATELSAGFGFNSHQKFNFFDIIITLTDQGADNIDIVISEVMNYINMLRAKSVDKWIWDEILEIRGNAFKYKKITNGNDYTNQLAINLLYYEVQNIILENEFPIEFEPEKIKSLYNYLSYENLLITYFNQSHKCSSIEPLFQSHYDIESIDINKISQYKPDSGAYFLPEPNPFLSSDYTIYHDDNPVDYPQIVFKNRNGRIFAKLDHKYNLPKLCLLLNIYNITISRDLSYKLYLSLILQCILKDPDNISHLYQAEICKYSYQIEMNKDLSLVLVGNCNKHLHLYEYLLQLLFNWTPNEEIFQIIKDQHIKKYSASIMSDPYDLMLKDFFGIVAEPTFSIHETLHILKDTKLSDLIKTYDILKQGFYYELLVIGNYDSQYIENLTKVNANYLDRLNATELFPISHYILPRTIILETDTIDFYCYNHDTVSGCSTYLIQIGEYTPELLAKTELFVAYTSADCYDKLRTQEQLGYIVWLNVASRNNYIYLFVLVQSNEFLPVVVSKKILEFLDTIKSNVINENIDMYNMIRENLILKFRKRLPNIGKEFERYKSTINTKIYDFNAMEIKADYLASLGFDEFKEWVESDIYSQRRSLLLQCHSYIQEPDLKLSQYHEVRRVFSTSKVLSKINTQLYDVFSQ